MPAQFQDYYSVLGVSRDASEDDIKKAFRKLARKYHPDVAQGADKAGAEEKFKEINEAYEVLGDPANRKKYDELGPNWNAQTEGYPGAAAQGAPSGAGGAPFDFDGEEFRFGGTGYSDFFEQFFGGRARFRTGANEFRRRAGAGAGEPVSLRGADVEGAISVTLDEVMHGSMRTISLQRVDPATGEAETETFKVRIPPGVQEGKNIRVPGQGGKPLGDAPPGDLYLRVRFAAHPDFRVDGADLYLDLAVAPWEAVLGANVTVPTLDGAMTGKIPAGVNAGAKIRLRGRGLPAGKEGTRGDLYLVVEVRVPDRVTPEERELWERLRQISAFHPRERD